MGRILTVFFSMTGETWSDHGIINVEKGFTNIAAGYIQDAVGGDLFQIKQKRQYSPDHMTMIQEAKEEYDADARPEIEEYLPSIAAYDKVFLGFPNWWGTVPMPVLTFLEHYGWSGKKIIPFVTSGGTGFGNALDDIRKACRNAEISEYGLEIKGTDVPSSREQIQSWARQA